MSYEQVIECWENGVEPYMAQQQQCIQVAREMGMQPQYPTRTKKTRPTCRVGPKKGIRWLAFNINEFNKPKFLKWGS